MNTEFNWSINALNCYPKQEEKNNVVFMVHWACSGKQDEYYGSVYSACNILSTEGDFTPYEDLTKEQVLAWVWANGVDKDAVEAAVQAQIDGQINPKVVTPVLPWNAL